VSGFAVPPEFRSPQWPFGAPGALAAPQGEAPQGEKPGGAPLVSNGAGRFGGVLADAIDRVQGLQQQVSDQVQSAATGEPVALHDIMLAMDKSEVAFNLMLEVRNRLLDAWDKVSRAVV
jgi:flagellar hook-basal body complex protein FliE